MNLFWLLGRKRKKKKRFIFRLFLDSFFSSILSSYFLPSRPMENVVARWDFISSFCFLFFLSFFLSFFLEKKEFDNESIFLSLIFLVVSLFVQTLSLVSWWWLIRARTLEHNLEISIISTIRARRTEWLFRSSFCKIVFFFFFYLRLYEKEVTFYTGQARFRGENILFLGLNDKLYYS